MFIDSLCPYIVSFPFYCFHFEVKCDIFSPFQNLLLCMTLSNSREMLKASPHQLKRPKLPCFLRAQGKCYETQYVLGSLGSQVTWDNGDNVPLSSNIQLELVAKM